MNRQLKLILAAGIAVAAVAGGSSVASAWFQDASAELRASGKAGEQADGYLGVVGSADASLRAQVDAINIKRRAYYTDLGRQARREDRGGRCGDRLRDLLEPDRAGPVFSPCRWRVAPARGWCGRSAPDLLRLTMMRVPKRRPHIQVSQVS
jgi:uncharacterized protein YdbL (DUF1318 family)